MKKRKIKKSVKFVLLILVIMLLIFLLVIRKEKSNKIEEIKEEQEEKIDYKEYVISKLSNDEDKNFLNWFCDNYKETLVNIYNYLESNTYNEDMWHEIVGYSYKVLKDFYSKKYDNMDNVKIFDKNSSVMTFVGDVSLADNWAIMPKYDERGKGVLGILDKDVLNELKGSDFFTLNSEFTVSERGSAMKNKQYTFRAHPKRLSIYDEMGLDLALLANNHVYDYGRDAFLDMLDHFKNANIPYIGAGKNLDEAKKAYYIILNGEKIAFLNSTRAEKYVLTPGASKDSEGVFRCYDTTEMVNEIKKAKEESDIVISIVHFGKEFSHDLEDVQIKTAKEFIDAGSDIVIGHHAHVLQGVEFYKDKPIIYNLGNFIFNAANVDTAIFKVIVNGKNINYEIIPCIQKDMYTYMAKDLEKQRIINDINSWSINAYLDENGKILKKY